MSYKTKSISKDKFLAMNESKFISDYKAPTYMSTFLNNVNGYAQATRKETVGALATVVFPEYLEQTDSPSPTDWKKYYLDNYQLYLGIELSLIKSFHQKHCFQL